MLLQLFHFFPPLYSPLPCTPQPTRIPHPQCMCMGHTCVIWLLPFPMLFLTSPCLLYQPFMLLTPCTFFPILPLPLHVDNPPCDLHFCDSVPVLVVSLICFCGFFCFCFQVQLLIVVSLLSFCCYIFDHLLFLR